MKNAKVPSLVGAWKIEAPQGAAGKSVFRPDVDADERAAGAVWKKVPLRNAPRPSRSD